MGKSPEILNKIEIIEKNQDISDKRMFAKLCPSFNFGDSVKSH